MQGHSWRPVHPPCSPGHLSECGVVGVLCPSASSWGTNARGFPSRDRPGLEPQRSSFQAKSQGFLLIKKK